MSRNREIAFDLKRGPQREINLQFTLEDHERTFTGWRNFSVETRQDMLEAGYDPQTDIVVAVTVEELDGVVPEIHKHLVTEEVTYTIMKLGKSSVHYTLVCKRHE